MAKRPVISVIVFAVLAFLQACVMPPAHESPQVCFARDCFEVEIAGTDVERARGLQQRRSLGKDKGMLFIFPEPGRYGFWMKNTLIPLDMIWLDRAGKVVTVAAGVSPCAADPCPSHNPKEEALYVLELNGGIAEKSGILVGDQAEFRGINK